MAFAPEASGTLIGGSAEMLAGAGGFAAAEACSADGGSGFVGAAAGCGGGTTGIGSARAPGV
jgi:hypothetical protein